MEQYVSGINCAPTTAREEMIAVKKRFGKEGGIVAFHGYQSFAPGECNPAMAHENMTFVLPKRIFDNNRS